MLSRIKLSTLLIGATISSVLLFPENKSSSEFLKGQTFAVIENDLNKIKTGQSHALNLWRQFQSMLMEEFCTITYEQVSEEELNFIMNKVKNLALPILKSVMTQGAKSMTNLSSYEVYLFSSMLDSSMQMVKKNSIAYRFMNHTYKKLQAYEKTPYEYLQGNGEVKTVNNDLKIFNWNTCLLPGKLAKVVSGLNPWQERIDTIIEKIKSQKADIVCLQEVHSEQAASTLYEALKDTYAHFYINMGPMMMGLKMSEIGLNSGLFVASNVALEEVHFEAFHTEAGQKNVNKGFFWAKVEGTDVGFATCHLEPFNQDHCKDVRYEELNHLVNFLSTKNTPIRLMCGDLNIPWGSGEKGEELIRSHFYDPYNKNRTEVNRYCRTFSDVFVSQNGSGSEDILDYFLIFQVPGFEKYAFITERVEGFDEVQLKTKGSDHHGLYSQIIFPYSQK